MKRMLTVGFLLCCTSVGSSARAQSPVQFGVQTGLSIATLVGSGAGDVGSRVFPFVGGTLVVHHEGSFIGFQTGLAYVPKGASTYFQGALYTLETSYLEIPLLVRIGLPLKSSNIMPVFSVGGSVGIKAGCNLSAQSGNASSGLACDDTALQGQFNLKTFDIGLTGGLDVDIPIGQRIVLAPGLRYTRGISVIGDTSYNADASNSAFQIGVSFRIRP